jgi:hypothetical protein
LELKLKRLPQSLFLINYIINIHFLPTNYSKYATMNIMSVITSPTYPESNWEKPQLVIDLVLAKKREEEAKLKSQFRAERKDEQVSESQNNDKLDALSDSKLDTTEEQPKDKENRPENVANQDVDIDYSEKDDSDTEFGQQRLSQDDMTYFLTELNKLNSQLSNRKEYLRKEIDNLLQDIKQLEEVKKAPFAFVSHLNKERKFREIVKNALSEGIVNQDSSLIRQLPLFNEDLSKTIFKDPCHKSYYQYEPVFTTEKVQRAERPEMMKKRDAKELDKIRSDPLYDEIHLNKNGVGKHTKDSGFNYVNCLPKEHNAHNSAHRDKYGVSELNQPEREKYEHDNYPIASQDNYGNFIVANTPPMKPFIGESNMLGDNRMLYPSQNPHVGTSDYYNQVGNNHLLPGRQTKNCEYVGKAEGGLPTFSEFFNNNNDELFKEDDDQDMLKIKKEEESNAKAFHSLAADQSKGGIVESKTIKLWDVENDPFNEDSFEEEHTEINNFEEDENTFNIKSEIQADPAYPSDQHMAYQNFTKEEEQKMGIMHSPGYLIPQDQIYGDGYDPINGGYHQGGYMMDPQMYQNPMMACQFVKAEGEIAHHYPMNPMYYDLYDPNRKIKKENGSRKGKKRNKYRMLPADVKRKAVYMAMNSSPKKAAEHYSVPLKSLKRWMKVGCERKKGGGRKTKDPLMEKNLYSWYIEMKSRGEDVTARMIKEKAIELTNWNDFIASKGWLDKFKVRYNLEISKESCRDGSKRKGYNTPIANREAPRMMIPTGGSYYPGNLGEFSNFRRCINKSSNQDHIKQEKQHDDSIDDFSDVNSDDSDEENCFSKDLDSSMNKDDIQNETYRVSLIKNSVADNKKLGKKLSNMVSLPLCDADESGDEFTGT